MPDQPSEFPKGSKAWPMVIVYIFRLLKCKDSGFRSVSRWQLDLQPNPVQPPQHHATILDRPAYPDILDVV